MERAISWAYISGFFDADGSITLKDKDRFRPSLSFHNTDLNILDDISEFIEERTGIEGYLHSYQPKNPKHKIQHTLSYNGIAKVNEIAQRMRSKHAKKQARFRVTKAASKLTMKPLQQRLIDAFYRREEAKEIEMKNTYGAAA